MNESSKSPKRKSKNPLYVVTNKGQDVEQASGVFDLWVKKLGLDPVMDFLNFLIQTLSSMVSNYAMFVVVKEMFDHYLTQIEFFLSKLGLVPVAPFHHENT